MEQHALTHIHARTHPPISTFMFPHTHTSTRTLTFSQLPIHTQAHTLTTVNTLLTQDIQTAHTHTLRHFLSPSPAGQKTHRLTP